MLLGFASFTKRHLGHQFYAKDLALANSGQMDVSMVLMTKFGKAGKIEYSGFLF
jgi:hypothetical protein